jgi:hypothetical protein
MKAGGTMREGMTLIEVLIACTLSALILVSLTAAAGNMFRMYDAGRREMELSQDLAMGLSTVMRTIRRSEEAVLTGTHGIVLTEPSGRQVVFNWSGTAQDPLTLKIDTNATLPLIDGLTGLAFQIMNRDVDVDGLASANTQVFAFDYFPSAGASQWRLVTHIGTGDLSGFAFYPAANQAVEALELTQVRIRLGKIFGQSGDLRIYLFDVYTRGKPRPIGPPLAYKDFSNASIPWATDPWDPLNSLNFATFDLGPDFTIHPNRPYCFLLQSLGPGEACCMRVREAENVLLSVGDKNNGLRPLISHDSGATWIPDIGTNDYDDWDIPAELSGDVFTTTETTSAVKHAVEVSITIERNGESLNMVRRERLLGGGTH